MFGFDPGEPWQLGLPPVQSPGAIVLPNYASIATLGDSIAAGVNASASATRWANLLAGDLSATLLNQGVSGTVLQNSADAGGGARSGNGRDNFVARVLGANKKAALFIAYGFNDARYIGAPGTFNVTAYRNDYGEVLSGLILGGYAPADLYVGSPYYITDQGLLSYGSDPNFSGQSRAGFEAYVAAAASVAAEYGVNYCDLYAVLRDTGFAATIDADNIHPLNAGHALIRDAWEHRTYVPNPRTAPAVSGSSAGAGLLTVTVGTVPGAVSYTAEYGVEGSFAFGNGATGAGPAFDASGLGAGSYRVRARANFAGGLSSPWAFAASATTVAGSGGSGGTVLGQTESYAATPDNTFLESTSPTSGTWVKLSTAQTRIYAQSIKGSGSTSTTVSYQLASAAIGGGVTGVFAQATLNVLTNTSGNLGSGVIVRAADQSNYLVAFYNGQNIRLFKRVGGTMTQIGSTYTVTLTGTSNVLRLEAGVDSQTVYLNGAVIITGTEPDSNLTAPGNGMGVYFATNSSTTFTGTVGTHFSSVTVGSLP